MAAGLIPRYAYGVYEDAREMAHPERLERRTRATAFVVPHTFATMASNTAFLPRSKPTIP